MPTRRPAARCTAFASIRVKSEPAVVTRVDAEVARGRGRLQAGDSIESHQRPAHSNRSTTRKSLLIRRFRSHKQPLKLTLRSGKVNRHSCRAAARSQPARASRATLQRDRRRPVGLAAVVVLSVSPPRRRSASRCCSRFIRSRGSCWRSFAPTSRPCSAPGLSISQNISVVLLACGLALWWYLSRQPRASSGRWRSQTRGGDTETRRQGDANVDPCLQNGRSLNSPQSPCLPLLRDRVDSSRNSLRPVSYRRKFFPQDAAPRGNYLFSHGPR